MKPVRKKERRGSLLLEFALVLPLILALMVVSVDLGRLVLAQTTLQDAVSVAARAGARQGYAGQVPQGALCASGSLTGNPSYDAFCESFRYGALGGYTLASFRIESPSASGGSNGPRYCTRGTASASDLFVTTKATANMAFITPLLREVITRNSSEGAVLSATAVARCENAR